MAPALLVVSESLRIARPIEVVRQQFADVRHHSARNVHPDLRFTPLAEAGDGCRYPHEVRVAGIRQVAEVILTREADGSQTNRFVSGANAGTKILHRFRSDGAEVTVVEVTVQTPLQGLRRLLAPLVRHAVRRRLIAGLREDRRDLEDGGYPVASTLPSD
jgi:hypothetical protein